MGHPQTTQSAAIRGYPQRSEGPGPVYSPWPPTSAPVSVVQAAPPPMSHPSVITAGGRSVVEMPRPAHMGPVMNAAPPVAHMSPAHSRMVSMANSPPARMTVTASPPVQRSLTITPSSSPGLSSKVSPLPPGRQPVSKPPMVREIYSGNVIYFIACIISNCSVTVHVLHGRRHVIFGFCVRVIQIHG
jgi:hypothetical protein